MDSVPLDRMREIARNVQAEVQAKCSGILEAIEGGDKLTSEYREKLGQAITETVGQPARQDETNGDDGEPEQTD